MKILIIDNNIDSVSWGAQNLCRLAHLAPSATLTVRRAPHQDLPPHPSAFDRIIISGSKTSAMDDSPWVLDLISFLQGALKHSVPILGVCYGHQILARTLGSKDHVRRAKEPEFGWTKIRIEKTSPLLAGLPETFFSFSAHFDEVHLLPAGTQALAGSEACAIQAFQLKDAAVFGIQFHPEKTLDEAEKIFSDKKKNQKDLKLLFSDQSQTLYDPEIGRTIFNNFFRLR